MRAWVEQPPVVVGALLTIPSESDWKDRAAEIADRFRLTGRAGGAGGRFGSPGHNFEVPDLKSWSVQGEGVILLRKNREDLGQWGGGVKNSGQIVGGENSGQIGCPRCRGGFS